MPVLIFISALLVIVAIVISIATAYDLARQKTRLRALDKAILEAEDRVEKARDQAESVYGTYELNLKVREEKRSEIRRLMEELETLEAEEEQEHQVGVSAGLRQRTMEDALGGD